MDRTENQSEVCSTHSAPWMDEPARPAGLHSERTVLGTVDDRDIGAPIVVMTRRATDRDTEPRASPESNDDLI